MHVPAQVTVIVIVNGVIIVGVLVSQLTTVCRMMQLKEEAFILPVTNAYNYNYLSFGCSLL